MKGGVVKVTSLRFPGHNTCDGGAPMADLPSQMELSVRSTPFNGVATGIIGAGSGIFSGTFSGKGKKNVGSGGKVTVGGLMSSLGRTLDFVTEYIGP